MDEFVHKLILDYRDGGFQARCSCGEWRQSPVSIRVQRLREVYGRIEEEHGRHVEEAENHLPTPA